ncbi:glycoside hydrolase family 31 protein [Leptolyngbya sp. FACHB-261]|uniref:glycoside hydrolase family 31 protein n=1 Tax=Leptolyngbya sp. FACHB-261 TaxID=2692806 RepID=UPI001681DB97|nr:glycoside hydrolase family 31 protein [Leptolyngbya sp. FACHB-261]MBD2102435.1 glycoside hydrolase family 31 protein [Leptolyngbya sp. FACHB-261]
MANQSSDYGVEFQPSSGLEQPWIELGVVQTVESDARTLYLDCGGPRLTLSVLAPNLIRVRLAPTGEFLPRRSWAVTQPDDTWPPVPFELRQTETAIEIETGQIRLVVERNPCRLSCFDHAGRPFAQDTKGMAWRLGAVAGWKHIEAEEHFYGFGERTGLLDKRSEIKTNWTVDTFFDQGSPVDNMYHAIPFFIALRPHLGYGLFFNTTFWSQFDLGANQPGVWQMQTQGPELDYYIIYGPEPAQILLTYTELTGRMPLPPRWALGYHQCRWSYRSEWVVRDLAREFRSRRIPCDVIHLDIDYMRGYRVFTWSPQRFGQPADLIKDLAQAGFKTVTIVDPGVKHEPEAGYTVFDQGVEHNCFVRKPDGQLFHGYVWPDKSVFPDFLNPEVRDWWGDWHKELTQCGVAGIWNDMNEPSIQDRPFGDGGKKVWFPLNALQGPSDEQATHAEVHNLYGQMMARAAREGLNRLRPSERSFVLTRAGYAGIQRWSAVWMGDNQSQWDHLEMSLPMLSNMGLSGVAFVGCDIGGFAGNATAEMFARWMQVGLLYPFMRGHSAMSSAQHEPWVFGEAVERICREYIELRYRLLPYIYTLCWEAATTGAPILRPLLYHFPNDVKTYALYDQVLLGPWLMAAPVYRPGVECRAVYLPKGTWTDWWSGERYEGPTHILAQAPLERLPLYVRAGAILPMAPVMQYTDERPLDELTLRIWPGTAEWTFYEDDGHSFDYQNGAYATTTYRVYTDGSQTTVEIGAREGQWTPAQREITVELVGVGEQRFTDDGTARRLSF